MDQTRLVHYHFVKYIITILLVIPILNIYRPKPERQWGISLYAYQQNSPWAFAGNSGVDRPNKDGPRGSGIGKEKFANP